MRQREIALATCDGFPTLEADDAPLIGLLAKHGATAAPVIWDDPSIDWPSFDLVVLRSTWDYPRRTAAFLDWIDRLPRVLNPAAVVRWNIDKHYLQDLAAAGVPIVPASFVAPGEPFTVPAGQFVVKPAIGAGSKDAARYNPGQADKAVAHVERLHRAGMTVIVQPYLDRVETDGETAVIYFRGEFSHAVRKGALLGDGPREEGALFFRESIQPHRATPAERVVAEQALTAVPGGTDRLLYARVDLLPTAEGPVVVELELIEPSLFCAHAPGAHERLAAIIARAAAE